MHFTFFFFWTGGGGGLALIRGWALNRINTVINFKVIPLMFPQRDKPIASSRNTIKRNYVNSLREIQITALK